MSPRFRRHKLTALLDAVLDESSVPAPDRALAAGLAAARCRERRRKRCQCGLLVVLLVPFVWLASPNERDGRLSPAAVESRGENLAGPASAGGVVVSTAPAIDQRVRTPALSPAEFDVFSVRTTESVRAAIVLPRISDDELLLLAGAYRRPGAIVYHEDSAHLVTVSLP